MIYWQTSDSKTKSSPSPGVVAAQIQSHSPAPRRCLSIQKPPGTLPRCQTHQPGNFMDHLSVSSQQKYSHTMFVQRFTINYFSLSNNHIKKLTEKHIIFFFKTLFLGKIFNDEFWGNSMPGPRPRWWRARAASRCGGWGPSAPSAASPGDAAMRREVDDG